MPENKNARARKLMGDRYFCTKCRRNHWMTSKIGKAHLEYNEEETPEEAAQPIGEETVTPPKKKTFGQKEQ